MTCDMANPNQLTRRVRTGKIGDLPLDILLEIWRLVEDSGAVARRALKHYFMRYQILMFWLRDTAMPIHRTLWLQDLLTANAQMILFKRPATWDYKYG